MTTHTRHVLEGEWIVRGIMPVIEVLRISDDGRGVLEMWAEEVLVTIDGDGTELLLRTAIDATFPLTIATTVDDDTLRMRFTNVGVDFELSADRADPQRMAAHRASRPQPEPVPSLVNIPDEGLAPTPPMGWNSWFGLRLQVTDQAVRDIADAMITTGLRDAGYTAINLDDGWQGGRDARGNLLPHDGFPDMHALGDFLHERGLSFGIYSSPGPATCADYTGSAGHEESDARTFASWGIDFLKYDWCSAGAFYRTEHEMRGIFQRMGQALRASGRPIVFSLCQYGMFDVPRWGATVGANLWRTSYDVEDTWDSIAAIAFTEPTTPARGWNDLDMLQIGLGNLTLVEYRTQLTLWSMRSAPLIISCDPRNLSTSELALLSNPDLIRVDQDPLGEQPTRFELRGADIWVKKMTDGLAVSIANRSNQMMKLQLSLGEIGLMQPEHVTDVWGHGTSIASETIEVVLASHDCALLRLH